MIGIAFYDRVAKFVRNLRDRFLGRKVALPISPPIPTVVPIHFYVTRASGVVMPPLEAQRKGQVDKNTVIQFELSFEDSPYFRTVISDPILAERRFKEELKDLVSDQEVVSVNKKAFSYTVPISSNKFFQEYLDASLQGRKRLRKQFPDEFKIGKPIFDVQAISFEPVGSASVPLEILSEFTATDEFVFKLYRPEDYHESAYFDWKGFFKHKLG